MMYKNIQLRAPSNKRLFEKPLQGNRIDDESIVRTKKMYIKSLTFSKNYKGSESSVKDFWSFKRFWPVTSCIFEITYRVQKL